MGVRDCSVRDRRTDTVTRFRCARSSFGLRDSHTGRPWPQVRGHDRRVTCSEWAIFVAGATMSRRTAEPAPTPGLILPDARMDLLWDGARLFVTGPDTTARWHRTPGEFPTQRRPHHDDQRSDTTPRTSQHRSRRKTARRVQTRSPLRILLLRAATDDVYHASPDVNTWPHNSQGQTSPSTFISR
jgi:hypothetical protein